MTNSEAIEVLTKNYPDPCFESLREAVDEAIKALSVQPIVKCRDCKFGIPCGRQIQCELMEYIHFERNDFCSQGVAK